MTRVAAIRAALFLAILLPLGAAATSPLLAWRDPIYIGAGFAGILALGLTLVQPVLASGWLGLAPIPARKVHRLVGFGLMGAVIAHVAGLWITSPPDVIDALLFRSPTPFSAWGVVAMGAIFLAAFLVVVRRRLPVAVWRVSHKALAAGIVVGSVVHAVLIEGTMETVTKLALCALVLGAALRALSLKGGRAFRGR